MKKLVLIFGIIAGLISGGMFFVLHPEDGQMDFSRGAVYGYLTMAIALSTIFFAVKQYRDKYNDGVINFGKSFLIGLYITLIAGAIYVLCWEIYYTNYASDFGEQYVTYLESELISQGVSADKRAEELSSTRDMMESYSNSRLMRMGLTLMEIVPVGLLISLISALIFGKLLKKKEPLIA